jgi:hypothetical protein
MKIKVLHAKSLRDFPHYGVTDAEKVEYTISHLNEYNLIAELQIPTSDVNEGLNAIYGATQHLQENWCDIAREYDCNTVYQDSRSTSIGDVLVVNGEYFLVNNYGFLEMDIKE